MLIELMSIANEEDRNLSVWANLWCEAARSEGFISMPYHPDAAMLERLIEYFRAGIDADDAVFACFALKH